MGGQVPLVAAQPGRTGGAPEHMTAAGQPPAQARRPRLPVRVIDLCSAAPLDLCSAEPLDVAAL
jgi:hypothetical protein